MKGIILSVLLLLTVSVLVFSNKYAVKTERQMIMDQLKARQHYWINQKLEDYVYMQKIADNAVKRKAELNWPLDYSSQKYWYNEQIGGKQHPE